MKNTHYSHRRKDVTLKTSDEPHLQRKRQTVLIMRNTRIFTMARYIKTYPASEMMFGSNAASDWMRGLCLSGSSSVFMFLWRAHGEDWSSNNCNNSLSHQCPAIQSAGDDEHCYHYSTSQKILNCAQSWQNSSSSSTPSNMIRYPFPSHYYNHQLLLQCWWCSRQHACWAFSLNQPVPSTNSYCFTLSNFSIIHKLSSSQLPLALLPDSPPLIFWGQGYTTIY